MMHPKAEGRRRPREWSFLKLGEDVLLKMRASMPPFVASRMFVESP